MKLTDRDSQLLALLQSYGCLTTRQIAFKLFPGVRLTTVLRRLRYLCEEGLIQRILGLESSERLWALTKKSVEKFQFESAKTNFPRAILEHDSLLSALRIRLEESIVTHSWIAEHAIRKRVAMKHGISSINRRVIPDGIMGIKVGGVNESIALELELSNKNQERYREILWDYSKKESLFAVWYVVNSKTIQRQIEQAKNDVYFGLKGPKLYFSLLDDVLENSLTAKLVSGGEVKSLSEIFMSPVANQSAQAVSGQSDQEPASEFDLTTCNDGTHSDPHALNGVPLPPLATHHQHSVVCGRWPVLTEELKHAGPSE